MNPRVLKPARKIMVRFHISIQYAALHICNLIATTHVNKMQTYIYADRGFFITWR